MAEPGALPNRAPASRRVQSMDALRGAIMMAIDTSARGSSSDDTIGG